MPSNSRNEGCLTHLNSFTGPGICTKVVYLLQTYPNAIANAHSVPTASRVSSGRQRHASRLHVCAVYGSGTVGIRSVAYRRRQLSCDAAGFECDLPHPTHSPLVAGFKVFITNIFERNLGHGRQALYGGRCEETIAQSTARVMAERWVPRIQRGTAARVRGMRVKLGIKV